MKRQGVMWAMAALLLGGCASGPAPLATAPAAPIPAPAPAAPAPVNPLLVAPSQAEATRQQRLATMASGEAALAPGEQGYYLDVLYAQMRQLLGPDAVLERGAGSLRMVLPSTVRFEVASAQLSDEAIAVLDPILAPLADYRSLLISVHGHTDASGPTEVNLRLSAQRALTVANKLVALGVPARQVMAIGHGADQPAADNETAEGRQANRRVELLLEVIQGRGA